MATVKTIETSFESMTKDQKDANLATLKYIKGLASQTNTDIARWDILKLFGSGDGANLLSEKSKINTIFFEKVGKLLEKRDLDVPDIEKIPALAKAIEECFQNSLEDKKAEIKSVLASARRNLETTQANMQRYMLDAVKAQQQLTMLTLNPEPVLAVKREIQETLKLGIWINPVVSGHFLYLNTPNDIILKHKNKAAKIDIELNVGQLAVKVDLRSLYMIVIPYKNNIVYDDDYDTYSRFYHPHVDGMGGICWGNALQSMEKNTQTFSLGKNLQLLYALLNSYSDSSPFIHLNDLKDYHKKYSRIPAAIKHPDKVKKGSKEAAEASPVPLRIDGVPQFVVGETVEAEFFGTQPRWDFSIEQTNGESEWRQGRVISIADNTIEVEFNAPGRAPWCWEWPAPGHHEYRTEQWNYPGYLRRVVTF